MAYRPSRVCRGRLPYAFLSPGKTIVVHTWNSAEIKIDRSPEIAADQRFYLVSRDSVGPVLLATVLLLIRDLSGTIYGMVWLGLKVAGRKILKNRL